MLRNSYESSEHFEENLQAVLFDAPTRMPSRQIADVLAGPFVKFGEVANLHWLIVPLLLFLLLIAGLWRLVRQRKKGRME